jgi:hypothetical protein
MKKSLARLSACGRVGMLSEGNKVGTEPVKQIGTGETPVEKSGNRKHQRNDQVEERRKPFGDF